MARRCVPCSCATTDCCAGEGCAHLAIETGQAAGSLDRCRLLLPVSLQVQRCCGHQRLAAKSTACGTHEWVAVPEPAAAAAAAARRGILKPTASVAARACDAAYTTTASSQERARAIWCQGSRSVLQDAGSLSHGPQRPCNGDRECRQGPYVRVKKLASAWASRGTFAGVPKIVRLTHRA